ncbi:DUF1156 domain-containing protein [Nostoc sp. NZL]|uniref:DUF1156 domain-containing protein n=1 Tax=Nostoc sp. NZL TaxID=2650612 RepID=UPI001E621AB8|nr:DUF1156 domain-containing protein [Nostoc sp. NZL]MBG1245515.1 DUF1156 domain-containing protein [Nostoc sp. NZL]
MTYRKKLIEVALPLDAINQGSKPETENPFLKGHPRSIHNWWARTPLSISRAILFAQLIDDPGNDLPPDEAQKEREKLLDFVANLATWDATTDKRIITKAQEIIRQQFQGQMPEFWDMFGGRASIPLEAQRLGLKVTSSDLNPVAVTIQRALLEYPPKFRNRPPVHPHPSILKEGWRGLTGLVEDVKWYGEWIQQQAAKQLAEVYPKGPNGEEITAWLWARTVTCPNPVCKAQIPLVRTFVLSNKSGQKVWIEPTIDRSQQPPIVCFEIRTGKGTSLEGTVSKNKGATCLCCSTSVHFDYIRSEGQAKRIAVQLMAMVAEGQRARFYLPATREHENIAALATPKWQPNTDLPEQALGFRVQRYGFTKHTDLFTSRQLLVLTTFCELISQARDSIIKESDGDFEYSNAVTTYLACALSRLTDYCCAFTNWNAKNENVAHLFQRQTISMVWDFAEANPIYGKLSFSVASEWVTKALSSLPVDSSIAKVVQLDARKGFDSCQNLYVISTEPPYYDNISYADLSDFFYTWLRAILKEIDPTNFATLVTPKEGELIATSYRHNGSEEKAKQHFREGFLQVFQNIYKQASRDVPITVYYAFKQEEEEDKENHSERASTGWETMLEGLVDSGFQVTGTWPVRTNKKARTRAISSNALASAIVIVARPRPETAPSTTRRQFVNTLKRELPDAFQKLQQGNIAPVDLAQASIGPGMAIYSRYSKVLESDGTPMPVRTALQLINQTLDEFLAEQEGEFDAETCFALIWYEQHTFNEGLFGDAETLSKAKNTAVQGMVDAGILTAKAGKVRLLCRDELPKNWNPQTDNRLTVWEATQHMIRELQDGAGNQGAANLLSQLGTIGEAARELAYRLYNICDRKGWAAEGVAYNSLVISWPEISRLAAETEESTPLQMALL